MIVHKTACNVNMITPKKNEIQPKHKTHTHTHTHTQAQTQHNLISVDPKYKETWGQNSFTIVMSNTS